MFNRVRSLFKPIPTSTAVKDQPKSAKTEAKEVSTPTMTTAELLIPAPNQKVITSIENITTLLPDLAKITESYARPKRELGYIQIWEDGLRNKVENKQLNQEQARALVERHFKEGGAYVSNDNYSKENRKYTSIESVKHVISGMTYSPDCIFTLAVTSTPLTSPDDKDHDHMYPPREIYAYQIPGSKEFFVSPGFKSHSMKPSEGVTTNRNTLFTLEQGNIVRVCDSLPSSTSVPSVTLTPR